MNVLLVDDDQALCLVLKRYLERELFRVTTVHTAKDGLQEALSGKYDAVILDVLLLSGDGFAVLRAIRERSDLPVIMLTSMGSETCRIEGLEIGADDYLSKPCNPRELSARLRAILRRARSGVIAEEVLEIDDIVVDLARHRISINHTPVELTATEFNILNILIRDLDKVVDKNLLAEQAMQRPLTLFDRSLDMHVSNLRKKIGLNRLGKARIRTVRGVGYLYAPEDSKLNAV